MPLKRHRYYTATACRQPRRPPRSVASVVQTLSGFGASVFRRRVPADQPVQVLSRLVIPAGRFDGRHPAGEPDRHRVAGIATNPRRRAIGPAGGRLHRGRTSHRHMEFRYQSGDSVIPVAPWTNAGRPAGSGHARRVGAQPRQPSPAKPAERLKSGMVGLIHRHRSLVMPAYADIHDFPRINTDMDTEFVTEAKPRARPDASLIDSEKKPALQRHPFCLTVETVWQNAQRSQGDTAPAPTGPSVPIRVVRPRPCYPACAFRHRGPGRSSPDKRPEDKTHGRARTTRMGADHPPCRDPRPRIANRRQIPP